LKILSEKMYKTEPVAICSLNSIHKMSGEKNPHQTKYEMD